VEFVGNFAFFFVVVASDSICLDATATWAHKGGAPNAGLANPAVAGAAAVAFTPIKSIHGGSMYIFDCPWVLDVGFTLKATAGGGCACLKGYYRQFVRGRFGSAAAPEKYRLKGGDMQTDTYREDQRDNVQRFGEKGSSTTWPAMCHVHTIDAPGSKDIVGKTVEFELYFLGVAIDKNGAAERKNILGTDIDLEGAYITHWTWTCHQPAVVVAAAGATAITNLGELDALYGTIADTVVANKPTFVSVKEKIRKRMSKGKGTL